MSLGSEPVDAVEVSAWTPRSQVAVVCDQLGAIDRWNSRRRTSEAIDLAAAESREARLDRARCSDVVQRLHDAVVARASEHLVDSAQLLHSTAARRAVLVHRSAWFRDGVATALAERGVVVVTALENGADAVGCVIAEQPDLLLVEDSLAMLSGVEVLREVREFAPATLCAAQASSDTRVAELSEAGARVVFSRLEAPPEVAAALGLLVGV